MTPIFLPLVVSLVSVAIDTSRLVPHNDLRSGQFSVAHSSGQDPLRPAPPAVDISAVLSGSRYPERYRWISRAGSAEPGNLGGPVRPARVASDDGQMAAVLADPDQDSDEEFSWTSGVGMVGIGVRWRFR